jgi:UDPglucose--hexose-1-phosphate uridylyltransferase
MSHLRFDVTTNDWVIFAPERGRRPHEFPAEAGGESPSAPAACPFCPGNEALASPEVYALRRDGTAPDTPGWSVRVVPNKYPALFPGELLARSTEGTLIQALGGHGAHEVLIESPEHHRFLGHQPVGQIEDVLAVLRDRFNALIRDPQVRMVIPFKNHGERAGISLRHPHGQLIAMPVVPRQLRLEHAVATDYYNRTGNCLYCVLLEEGLSAGRRVLAVNDTYAAVLPYASQVPFEVWVLPRRHRSSFGTVPVEYLRPLAELLGEVLSKLYTALVKPDFNLTINTAPRGDESKAYFLCHIEILPRLVTPAGFETGSGMAINPVLPEGAGGLLQGPGGRGRRVA